MKKEGTMDFVDQWSDFLVILAVVGIILVMGGTVFNLYLEKARLTLSVAALSQVQETLKNYKVKNSSFPASLDLRDCSDQDHRIVLNCDEIKADLHSFVSYVGSAENFVLTARAKDSRTTLIKVTESGIIF